MTKIVGATALGLAILPAIVAAVRQNPSQQPPTFRTSTEIVLIDTQVVAKDGTPIQGLKADQFEVFIDGRRRPVVSAEFSRATESSSDVGRRAIRPESPQARNGRIIVLAIDQASFPSSARASAREAATRVVDRVAPEDYLGLIAFPGSIEIAPTRDRSPVREALESVSGLRVEALSSRFNLSAADAVVLKSRESVTTKEIIGRECKDRLDPVCPQQVMQEGGAIADILEQQAILAVAGIDGVLDAMTPLPGRKTLMLISAGLPMSNRSGGRLALDAETTRIGRRAAAANVNLYVLYMNIHFLRYFSPEYGKKNSSIFDDISLFGYGLEKFADSGGGGFFQVEVDSDPFVDRALRETSAAYVLAVRAEPEDHDGKDHFIRVAVKQKGATIRYRRIVTIPR